MTQLLTVENERRDEIFTAAADKMVPLSLSHRLDSGWATYKSRLLAADSAGRFLIIEQPMHTEGQVPPELVPGETIGLTFRRGHKKCMCSVQIRRLPQHDCDGQQVPALEIPWPEKLQEMQRRVYYRAEVPKGRRIEVQLWDGGALHRDPTELCAQPHHVGLLVNVSAGGCRIHVDASRDPQLEVGDTVGIQFQPDPRSEPLLLDAVYRHDDDDAHGKMALGFQFVGLETSPTGRQMLQRLSRVVSTFLRIDIRRKNRSLQKHPRRRK